MTSPQIHAQPVDYLLRELGRAKRENRKLREQNRKLKAARDRWRDEARMWKWGAVARAPAPVRHRAQTLPKSPEGSKGPRSYSTVETRPDGGSLRTTCGGHAAGNGARVKH